MEKMAITSVDPPFFKFLDPSNFGVVFQYRYCNINFNFIGRCLFENYRWSLKAGSVSHINSIGT